MKCILLRDSNKVLQNTTPERKSFVTKGNAKKKKNDGQCRAFHTKRGVGGRVTPDLEMMGLHPLSLEPEGYDDMSEGRGGGGITREL